MRSAGRILVVAILVLAGAGVAGLAASKTGLLDRLDAAYSTWSLKSRVKGYWDARVEGDIETVRGFIAPDSKRGKVGRAIKYLAYEIQEISMQEDTATVTLGIEYKVAVPGFTSDSDPARKDTLVHAWVRDGLTWYWQPAEPVGGEQLPPLPQPVEPQPESDSEIEPSPDPQQETQP